MYPVGVLFGFGTPAIRLNPQTLILLSRKGFDTASSIALLAVSALAKKTADGKGIAQSDIVILPVCTRSHFSTA